MDGFISKRLMDLKASMSMYSQQRRRMPPMLQTRFMRCHAPCFQTWLDTLGQFMRTARNATRRNRSNRCARQREDLSDLHKDPGAFAVYAEDCIPRLQLSPP